MGKGRISLLMVHINTFTSQGKKENQGSETSNALEKVLSQAPLEPKLRGQLGQPYPISAVCWRGIFVRQERPARGTASRHTGSCGLGTNVGWKKQVGMIRPNSNSKA